MKRSQQRPGASRPTNWVGRLRRLTHRFRSGPVSTETIITIAGTRRTDTTRPIGPVDVTNRPAIAKRAVYLAALAGAIRTHRRQQWTDGCSRVLLLWVGLAIIIGLAILLR